MDMQFVNFTARVTATINNAAIAFLNEAGGEIAAQAARRTRRDTGKTANSWDYRVDKRNKVVTIGSPEENAIWEEFGTGEYALRGNGRRGGWVYKNKRKGKFLFTRGKAPTRAFYYAYKDSKGRIVQRARANFRGLS